MKSQTVNTLLLCLVVVGIVGTFIHCKPADFGLGLLDGVILSIAIDAWRDDL